MRMILGNRYGTDGGVMRHFERLMRRRPELEGCGKAILDVYHALAGCFESGGKLMMVGNGGSCADCEHIAGELMKGFYLPRPLPEETAARIREETEDLLPGASGLLQQGLPAIALTGHPALTTAVQNDNHPLLAPAQQIVALAGPKDAVLGISTGGNAKNVLLAIRTAKALGLVTIGLTGENGGMLKKICDLAVAVPGNTSADVQELHLPVYHALCAMLEEHFFGGNGGKDGHG